MKKKQDEAGIDDQTSTLAEAIEQKEIAIYKQEDIVERGEELRDIKILDVNLIAIEGILKSKRISDTKFFPNDYSCSSQFIRVYSKTTILNVKKWC